MSENPAAGPSRAATNPERKSGRRPTKIVIQEGMAESNQQNFLKKSTLGDGHEN
jgi:hypothetical protein